MTRTTMTQAVAADYADAMLVARRAKNALFLFLALILLIQITMFFVARYVHSIHLHADATSSASADATTRSSTDVTLVEHPAGGSSRLASPAFEYVIALTNYGGVVLPIVLSIVLLLIITIMLVGRLVGVSHVTSAFCWSVLLMVLLFPWQALLNSQFITGAPSVTTTSGMTAPPYESTDIRIPGVLYTWPELSHDYKFENAPLGVAILKWARFVGFPVLALIILLLIQGRSSRGLRFALGESEVQVAEPTVPGGMGG